MPGKRQLSEIGLDLNRLKFVLDKFSRHLDKLRLRIVPQIHYN